MFSSSGVSDFFILVVTKPETHYVWLYAWSIIIVACGRTRGKAVSGIIISVPQHALMSAAHSEPIELIVVSGIMTDDDDDDDEPDPQACTVCYRGPSASRKMHITSCGHRYCDACLTRYVELRCKAKQTIVCPVCRRPLPLGDLPGEARLLALSTGSAGQLLAADALMGNRSAPQPVTRPADYRLLATTTACCCIAIGQLSEASYPAPRRRPGFLCAAVSALLYAGVFIAVLPIVLYGLMRASDASASTRFDLFGALSRSADRSVDLGWLTTLLCLSVWLAATAALSQYRDRLVYIHRTHFATNANLPTFGPCCIPCLSWQLLAALGYRSRTNYRLCSPLPRLHPAVTV